MQAVYYGKSAAHVLILSLGRSTQAHIVSDETLGGNLQMRLVAPCVATH